VEIADRPNPTRRRPDGRRPAHGRTYGILAVSLIAVLVVAGLGVAGGSHPAPLPVIAPRVAAPVVTAVGHRELVRRTAAAERVLLRDFASHASITRSVVPSSWPIAFAAARPNKPGHLFWLASGARR
jgi:hypothetical protein